MSPQPLESVIDALERGVERLREFDEWIASDGLQTFGEWLIKCAVPEDEQPRVIITPPPKQAPKEPRITVQDLNAAAARNVQNHYRSTYRVLDAVFLRLSHSHALSGITIWESMEEDNLQLRCHRCRATLKVDPYRYENKGGLMDFIGNWYREHGPNCGSITIVRGGQESL